MRCRLSKGKRSAKSEGQRIESSQKPMFERVSRLPASKENIFHRDNLVLNVETYGHLVQRDAMWLPPSRNCDGCRFAKGTDSVSNSSGSCSKGSVCYSEDVLSSRRLHPSLSLLGIKSMASAEIQPGMLPKGSRQRSLGELNSPGMRGEAGFGLDRKDSSECAEELATSAILAA